MSSITLDRPDNKLPEAAEVDEFKELDKLDLSEFEEYDAEQDEQQRPTDSAGLDFHSESRAEAADRSYDHGDAPPLTSTDGLVAEEYSHPT